MEAVAPSELLRVLESHARPDALAWLRPGLPAAGSAFARDAFFGFYAGAGRRFGNAVPKLSTEDSARLRAAGVAMPEVLSLADTARAALLLLATQATSPTEHLSIATEAFRRGDNGERIALLRALPLLPEPARFTELAIDACRSHVVDVFAAIACDNPFPARYFPELHFNQLVMKTLFVELGLERVIGWRERNNPELRRVAGDYEAERRAAGRPVPTDIASIKAT
jgi:hypothetical protein